MILVTGGLGFIGAHTARALLDAGEQVVVTRHRRADVPAMLQPESGTRLFVEPLDVTDAAAVRALLARHPIRSLVHLAVTPIGASSFGADFGVNLGGMVNLLEAAAEAGLERVTVASSAAVYGSLPAGRFREDDGLPVQSKTATEAFKKCEEVLAVHFAERSGLDVRCVRISSVYGPLYHSMVNVPSRIAHAAVRGVEGPLTHPAVPRTFADAAHDFCHVLDVADGLCRLHRSRTLAHRIYNLGSGTAVSPARVLQAVQRVLPGARAQFTPGGAPTALACMDLSRTAADTGYVPQYDIDRGMAQYLGWLQAGHAH